MPEKSPDSEFDQAGILAGMEALADKSGVDTGAEPADPAAVAAAAAEAAAEAELRGTAEPDPEPDPELDPAAEPAGEHDPEPDPAAGDQETDDQRITREAQEAAAAAKKALEGADADLEKAVRELEPHTKPKTKKLISHMKDEAVKARQASRDAQAKLAEAEARLAESQKKTAEIQVPEQVTKELETLRQRIQELDASQDPQLVAKYDNRIKSNGEEIMSILKGYGLGTGKDGKELPQEIEQVRRQGLTLKSLKPLIDKIEKDGDIDDAQKIRDLLFENGKLGRDKQQEIQTIKSTVGDRVAARTRDQQAAQSAYEQQVTAESGKVLQSDLDALAKMHPFVRRPAAPADTDTPAVKASRAAAVAEWDRANAEVGELVKSFNGSGKQGPEAVRAQATMVAHAIQGAVLKKVVMPRVQRDMAALRKRNDELTAELAKHKKGAAINGAHGAAVGSGGKPAAGEIDPKATTADAFAAFARAQGVPV